jgi:hypothetical protein
MDLWPWHNLLLVSRAIQPTAAAEKVRSQNYETISGRLRHSRPPKSDALVHANLALSKTHHGESERRTEEHVVLIIYK